MKYISYSLFGDSKLYCQGMLDNLPLIRKYYPDWRTIIYISENSPVLRTLESENVELVVMPPSNSLYRASDNIEWHKDPVSYNMTWRYHVLDKDDCEYATFRDADSRVNPREAAAVNEFVANNYLALCLYECKEHWNGVMPGMSSLYNVGFTYKKTIKQYIDEYLEVYKEGHEPMIFFDIHAFRTLFIEPVGYAVRRCGFGTDNPLAVPMPPEYGRFVGDVVHPEWRDEKWQPQK